VNKQNNDIQDPISRGVKVLILNPVNPQAVEPSDVVVAGIDGLSEALKIMKSGGQYVATALNDPRYLGDVTIQTAREVAAKRPVPTFIEAGTTSVTSANVGPFDLSALFASYRPKIFSEAK
jgi:ribose transport system substrate-binding protein